MRLQKNAPLSQFAESQSECKACRVATFHWIFPSISSVKALQLLFWVEEIKLGIWQTQGT